MVTDETIREAAKTADKAVARALRKYRQSLVTDEDDITGVLIGNLDTDLEGNIGGLTWSTSILRHRKGVAAEERRIGADMIIHVTMRSERLNYSKGVLVQAKRTEPGVVIDKVRQKELSGQCDKMLATSAASYVFNYATAEMRCESAVVAKGLKGKELHRNFQWTSYRFFLELFRCQIGDGTLTSARVRDLPAPVVLSVTAEER